MVDPIITTDSMTLTYIVKQRNPSIVSNGPIFYQEGDKSCFYVALTRKDYTPVLYLPFIYKDLPLKLI